MTNSSSLFKVRHTSVNQSKINIKVIDIIISLLS